MSDYLDKRKIKGIERRAEAAIKNGNITGLIVTLSIVTAFVVSTTHLYWEMRGGGIFGLVLGLLTSLSTEGVFLHHRYRTFPQHENTIQKFASLVGMAVAILGSLLFSGADLLLLLDLLNLETFAPYAIGGMVLVMLSAILTESIYELSSHVAGYEREKRADALNVLRISDQTRLELDRGDLEIMRAYSDMALATSAQKAASIRAAIPGHVEREAGQVEILTTDDIRERISANPTMSKNGKARVAI